MSGRGLDGRAKVVLGREVRHGVVDEHDVEGPSEPERAHVSLEVLALRVQPLTEREHVGREVRERAGRSAP